MRRIALLLALLAASQAWGQITVNSADLPMADEIIPYVQTFELAIDELQLDLVGENLEWDYSFLSTDGTQLADSFFTVESSPFLYQFFFNNNFLYPDSYSTHCSRSPEFAVGDFSLEDPYSYYNNSTDSYRQTGFGVTVSSIPFSVPYEGEDVWFEFPMNYGDEHNSDFTSELGIPGLGTWIQTAHRENVVDAWGTITTPNGTYDVLRHKSVLEASDSTYIDLLELGANLPRPDQYVYRWIANGETTPVMEVITNDILGTEILVSVRFQYDSPDAVEDFPKPHVQLYPNPASDHLTIEGMPTARIRVLDAAGREVLFCTVQHGESIDVRGWERGSYVVVVESQDWKQSFPVMLH